MNLLKLRKATNQSQESIANAVGLARASYSNIENGKRRPSVAVAKKIAAVLDFDWSKFYEDDAPSPNSDFTPERK